MPALCFANWLDMRRAGDYRDTTRARGIGVGVGEVEVRGGSHCGVESSPAMLPFSHANKRYLVDEKALAKEKITVIHNGK